MKDQLKAFWFGMGSIIALFPATRIPEVPVDQRSDSEKLASDWAMVSRDFRSAMDTVDREQEAKAS